MDLSLYQTKSFDSIDDKMIDSAVKCLTGRYFGKTVKAYNYLGGGSFGLAYKVDCDDFSYVLKFYSQDGMNTIQVEEMRLLRSACRAKIPEVYFCHSKDDSPQDLYGGDILQDAQKTATIAYNKATASTASEGGQAVDFHSEVLQNIKKDGVKVGFGGGVSLNAVGMEFIEGITCVMLDPKDYTESARRKMAVDVVTAIHDIHSVKGEKFGFIAGPKYDNWLDYYKPFAKKLHDWVLENGHDEKHKIPPEMVELFRQSWLLFDRIFDQPIKRPSLIHNDFCVCNFMVKKDTLELTAIIDPRETMYADVDMELHQLSNITGNDFFLFETYKQLYPVSKNCDVKCAFYAIYNEIYCYLLCGQSFEYIYPFMINRLKTEIEKYLNITLKIS